MKKFLTFSKTPEHANWHFHKRQKRQPEKFKLKIFQMWIKSVSDK